MKRWLLLPPLFAVGLFFALQAFAGTKDTRASVNVLVNGGQYELDLADIGDSVISSFTFQPAPTLHVASIASVTSMNGQPATCQLGGGGFTCSVSLSPPPCPCMPGDAVKVLFTGSGEIAGSVVQVMGVPFTVTGTGSVTTTSQTTTSRTTTTTSNPPPPPPPPTPAAQKITGTVGPGAKIVLKTSAKTGKTMVTVRDLSKKDNFHLQGPGVNKKTGVAWTGTVTWPVMLKKGAYTFRSDAHPTLHGTLKVS